MRIYTRLGDLGETSLSSGKRVAKDHPILQALGDLDECTSAMGVAASYAESAQAEEIKSIQDKLILAGNELASDKMVEPRIEMPDVEWLESRIDCYSQQLPALTSFVVPGGNSLTAHLHLARAIARRWERQLTGVHLQTGSALRAYANRLSDYLFILARYTENSCQN